LDKKVEQWDIIPPEVYKFNKFHSHGSVLNIIADTPEVRPRLKFDEYSNSLVQILRTQHNISLGIFGDWGTGKTTLMRLIEAKLTENVVDLMHLGAVDVIKILRFLERNYGLAWNEQRVEVTSAALWLTLVFL
jgi:hypothetical protein